jgi:transcription termination factor Rho
VFILRNFLADMPAEDSMHFLLQRLAQTKTNREFFQLMAEGG